ncbi:MAG: DNA repair protein RecN [Panacagrimonas sp.]
MLEQLSIRNLATIEALDLELDAGLTVLSGETGAGKSILIDALGLILGTRADPALVRSGSERAEISAIFRIDANGQAARWLADNELIDTHEPTQCLIRRTLASEGRTRAFINGSAVNAGKLRELGECLVDVYGQNESHSLRMAEIQRDLLDGYARHPQLLQDVATHARHWLALEHDIERSRSAAARDPAQLDLLRHQVRELEALQLKDGEVEQIEMEHSQLANAGRLLHDGALAQEQLYGADEAIYDQLAATLQRLRGLIPLHAGFAEAESLVSSAQAQVREAADELRRLLDRLDLDPARLADVEARMASIHDLARKHRVRAEDLSTRHAELRNQLDEAEHAGGKLDELLSQQASVLTAYRGAAQALSNGRSASAKTYAHAVTTGVRELGMPHARFEVRIELAERARPRVSGDDEICFDFSANPGQAPRPLAKVASGGELSRVSLAIQVVAQQADGAPTMIFDEVDAGIGGAVAESVGKQLRLLGQHRQVLCVTHLGQVAACGDQHLAVAKSVRGDQTYTEVKLLDGKARVAELARMIGGATATTATATMARELLKSARGS